MRRSSCRRMDFKRHIWATTAQSRTDVQIFGAADLGNEGETDNLFAWKESLKPAIVMDRSKLSEPLNQLYLHNSVFFFISTHLIRRIMATSPGKSLT